MSSKSRVDSQRTLGPMELRKSEPSGDLFRNSEHDPDGFRKSEQFAAELLHEALKVAGLDNKDIAYLCGVSQSLVEKWRSTEARGCPSYAQLLCLPASFHIALFRLMNKKLGLGRALIADVLQDVSLLALAVER